MKSNSELGFLSVWQKKKQEKDHPETCPSAKLMGRKNAHQFFKTSLQHII